MGNCGSTKVSQDTPLHVACDQGTAQMSSRQANMQNDEYLHDEEVLFRGIIVSGPSLWFIWNDRPIVRNYRTSNLSSEDLFVRECVNGSIQRVGLNVEGIQLAVGKVPIEMNDAICLAIQACEYMSRLDAIPRGKNLGLTEDRVCGVCLEGSYDRAMARKLDLRFCKENVDIPLNRAGLFVRVVPALNKIIFCNSVCEVHTLTFGPWPQTDSFLMDMEINSIVACRFGGMVQRLIKVGRDKHGNVVGHTGTISSYQAIKELVGSDSRALMASNYLSMRYSSYVDGRMAIGEIPKSTLWLADNGTFVKAFTFEQ